MQDAPNVALIERVAARMRLDIVEMIAKAGSGHPGGSLSSADIMAALYFAVMRHDSKNPGWPERDRFVLSKGHAAPALYAVLAEAGYFDRSHLSTLRELNSILQGHPDSKKVPGVEVSTGSLGQGLSIANGIALALRADKKTDQTVYCLIGDGELQEGQIWEAAMFAAHNRLDNLIAFVDHNGLQIDGPCSEVVCVGDLEAKFSAFGWTVFMVDGHDVPAILAACSDAAAVKDRPVVLICNTVKGKGVSFMENNFGWHGKAPNEDETRQACKELTCVLEEKEHADV